MSCPDFTVNANFGGYETYHDVQCRVIDNSGNGLKSVDLLVTSSNVSINTINRVDAWTIDFILHRKSAGNQAWMANLEFELDYPCEAEGPSTFPWFIGYDH